jgi:hypothetical protein
VAFLAAAVGHATTLEDDFAGSVRQLSENFAGLAALVVIVGFGLLLRNLVLAGGVVPVVGLATTGRTLACLELLLLVLSDEHSDDGLDPNHFLLVLLGHGEGLLHLGGHLEGSGLDVNRVLLLSIMVEVLRIRVFRLAIATSLSHICYFI